MNCTCHFRVYVDLEVFRPCLSLVSLKFTADCYKLHNFYHQFQKRKACCMFWAYILRPQTALALFYQTPFINSFVDSFNLLDSRAATRSNACVAYGELPIFPMSSQKIMILVGATWKIRCISEESVWLYHIFHITVVSHFLIWFYRILEDSIVSFEMKLHVELEVLTEEVQKQRLNHFSQLCTISTSISGASISIYQYFLSWSHFPLRMDSICKLLLFSSFPIFYG